MAHFSSPKIDHISNIFIAIINMEPRKIIDYDQNHCFTQETSGGNQTHKIYATHLRSHDADRLFRYRRLYRPERDFGFDPYRDQH